MWWHDGVGWWMLLMGLGTVMFWGTVLLLIILLVRNAGRRAGNGGVQAGGQPEDIARRRLASGEITEEEYDRIIRKLRE